MSPRDLSIRFEPVEALYDIDWFWHAPQAANKYKL
jgi:hypothetical protein